MTKEDTIYCTACKSLFLIKKGIIYSADNCPTCGKKLVYIDNSVVTSSKQEQKQTSK